MNSAVCTLFEGDYHLGLGELVNSLVSNGFTGCIWAGYRGDLPPWALAGVQSEKFYEYKVVGDCFIRFVRLDTETLFANYKSDFMLRVSDNFDPHVRLYSMLIWILFFVKNGSVLKSGSHVALHSVRM